MVLMSLIGSERERVAQILQLPDAYERILDMLARAYTQGWLNHEKYVMGSLELREADNPYLSRRQEVTHG